MRGNGEITHLGGLHGPDASEQPGHQAEQNGHQKHVFMIHQHNKQWELDKKLLRQDGQGGQQVKERKHQQEVQQEAVRQGGQGDQQAHKRRH